MSIKLHGKEYVEVKDRVAEAHADEGYSMLQEETFSMGGREYVRVYIEAKGKQYIGTAECKFNANPKTPDGMSPFECGETSALGRALGFAGYGAVDSIASADEVVSNELQVRTAPKSTDPTPIDSLDTLKTRCRNRAFKAGIKTLKDYEKLCVEMIGKPEPETLVDINAFNKAMDEREKKAS